MAGTWPLPSSVKLTPALPWRDPRGQKELTLCSLGLCHPGCREDSPKRSTEGASQGLTAGHNPRCQLTWAILKWICTCHPCSSHGAPARGAALYCFTSHETASEWNSSENSSEIALLVHCKCSTARYKAQRVHLLPGSRWEAQIHLLLWLTATISWPLLSSLLARTPDIFKSQLSFPLSSYLLH